MNANRNEVTGLCMTCNQANFCIYLASASSSIWSCEEFDDHAPVIEPNENLQETQPEPTIERLDVTTRYAKTA
jgi:hypothetical protein